MFNLLHEFRTFDKDRSDINDLIALTAFGKLFRDTCDELNVEEPEFVDVQIKALKRTIRARVSDAKAARLRQVQSQLDSLKTPAEKRKDLEAEAKVLAAELQEA